MVLKCIVFTVLLKLISVSCDKEYGSLTFVIDTTGSMQPEIQLVKDAANGIMDIIIMNNSSQIKDVNLVTFNDPSYPAYLHRTYSYDKSKTTTKVVLKESRDLRDVKKNLENLNPHWGWDCEEYSLSGIKMGLLESKPNSFLFVFTDAPPKDGHIKISEMEWKFDTAKLSKEVADVNNLAQSKGSPVFFFLTPQCNKNSEAWKAYYNIATASSGQVFILEKKDDVKLLLPFLEVLISGSVDPIKTKVIAAGELGRIPFTVDDQTEYVIISTSSPGGTVELELGKTYTPLAIQRISWTNNNKILKIKNPAPGIYEALVKGSTETTVKFFGRTDFNFKHGFAETVPPTFRNGKQQPTDGVKSFLLIKVNDPSQSVNIKTAQIVSADNEKTVYHSLPLTKQSKNYYSTESFLPPQPQYMFLIQVIGEGSITHKIIKRTAKTPLQSRPQDIDPVISIEGGGTYPYNSYVLLTCKVKASPKPRITWKDDKDNVLPHLRNSTIDIYNYQSDLYIKHLTRKGAYNCQAQAGLNGNSKWVDLDVTSPFVVNEDSSKVSETVEFESSVVLKCNIKSKFPMKIQWYHVMGSTGDILNNSATYHISSDGTEMTVNKVKQENEGKYICVARMDNDADTTYKLEREIKLKHIAPVMGKAEKIEVHENTLIHLTCNIVKAYPKPEVVWWFKSVESDAFRPLTAGDYVKINAASLSSAGVYKCMASNDKGSNSHKTTVIVLKKPTSTIFVNNEEKDVVSVEYNSTVKLSCHVISHPQSKLVWKNDRKEIMNADTVISEQNKIISDLKITQTRSSKIYSCEASNELGTSTKKVKVQVQTPFQVSTLAPEFTRVKYGDHLSINCGVTSKFPVKIIWKKETGELITTSDQYSVSSDGKVLQIKRVTLDSKGKYICYASIVNDELTQESRGTTVDVIVEKPKIEKQPDVTVRQNQTAVLKCHVTTGLPKPKITWMVKKEKMNTFTMLKEVGEILTLPVAQYQDAGLYKCIASNIIGTDEQTNKLIVEGPSKILSDEYKLYTALVGDDTLRIPCVTEGYPKPDISWTIGSKTLSGGKFRITTDNTLVIKNPQKEDSVEYTCKAANKYGTAEKTFEGLVMEYVDFDQDKESVGNTTYVDILEGTTEQLNCSSGSLKGRWYKEGYLLNLTGILTIKEAQSLEEGNYTCRLSNSTGSESHTYVVVVGKPPVFSDPDDEVIENWNGNAKQLSCAVSESRTAKAEWTYNGKPSHLATGEIAASLHPIVSWGRYTCTISNVHGNKTKHFTVHSTGCLMRVNPIVNKSPLVMDISGTWPKLAVKQNYIYMPHNQVILLSCHNENNSNFFKNVPKTSEIVAKCEQEDKFLVDGKTYKLSDLQCSAEVISTIKSTGEKCFFENTEILKVGFNVEQPVPHFLEVYSVCFDKSKNVPIYTKVSVTQTNEVRLEKPLWKKVDHYNEKNEEFCVTGSKCCVKQRQLVNQMEVAIGPAQSATFFKGLNTVPYWSGCENIDDTLDAYDEWIRSEIIEPYDLLSGAYDYVETNGTMVPRYLWKMVRSPLGPLIYVHVNDPHPKADDIRCKERHCPGVVPEGRFSYCCKPLEFQNAFGLSIINI